MSKTTLNDVRKAIERFQKAAQAACPRCPDGAKAWHDQIEAQKKDLIETVWLYGVSQVKFTED